MLVVAAIAFALAIVTLVFCAFCEIGLAFPVPGWLHTTIAILISGPHWPGPPPWQPRRLIAMIAVNWPAPHFLAQYP